MIVVSEVYIPEIDEQKTILNGKKLCMKYQPLVERRIKKNLTIPMNSTSLIKFSNQVRKKSSFENKIVEKLDNEKDKVGQYIKNICEIQSKDAMLGELLMWKGFYGLTDSQISAKMKIAERTIRKYKPKAFYLLAIYNDRVSYIYQMTYEFHIN